MSQNDEEKRQRSSKMCQLIYDREIDKEISYEIRKLLEEGVIIDFREENRHKKTALHLAVEKCDVKCVKFLLRFKPNFEVKDEDDKTPVELAVLRGYQSILEVLLNSTVDVVNESYVELFDYESITRQKIEAIKSRPTFKVLKLTNCPSVNEVWEKLNDYTTTLKKSSHLFFVTIETNETNIANDNGLMKKVLNLRRPIIVQLTSSKSQQSQIYFKDDKKDFVEISGTPQITQEEFNEAVQSDDECNMKLLVAAWRSNLFGHFTGNLLEGKLNTNEGQRKVLNQFAKSNELCHRFFKLFDEIQTQIDRIVASLSFKGDQSLLALLDLPFELKDEKLRLNEYQQDILGVVDSSGCNLLMMAVEQGNLDALKLLLRCGCDFNHSDNYRKRASDISWEMKAFDSLAELIEAGSPYPNNFRINDLFDRSKAYERINKMIEAINSFHEHIEKEETDEVKKFITSHPHIKHAFDTNNKCALTVALQSNRVETYSLLMSNGFEPGADHEYQSACSKSSHKNEIRNSHRKYFKDAFDEPHLKQLLKISRLSFGSKDRAKCSTIIRKMFDKLNEINEAIPILKICSLSDKLRIVFDFNCNSVVDMDPTSGSSSLGVVYPIGGFIYIGAKNHEKEFCKVTGTLIHELTHYAMKLTYENNCKPYDDDDIESEHRFETIKKETKKICDKNPSTDAIIRTVFSSYKPEVWHQELIVRVPHLLAHHKINPQAIETAERNTSELFHFYREKSLKDVETQNKVLLQEYLIRKINNQTGISRRIENLNVNFEIVEINLKPSVNVITSDAPQLTLALLNQFDCDDSHIFVTLEQVAIGNISDKIFKVNAKESSTALIIDCIELTQKYPESLQKLLKDVKNIKTIALVMTEVESSKLKENFPNFEFKTLNHKWDELAESSKVHLLDQNVIFQGVEKKLNELVNPSSEAMNFFPLGELLNCKDFKIGHELNRTSHKFYIPRNFVEKGQASSTRVPANVKSFEELLKNESRMGAMIISDEAGSGKSVALFEVAKILSVTFPDRWVQFVDLKRHIEAFKSIEDHGKIEIFEDFIVQNILKNETKFDQELFKKMFRDGKTFVLLDGFDEICPNYKDLLLHFLTLFQPRSGNKLFITSRPHLEADLEGVLGNFVFKLEKFAEDSQISFLREYWRSVKFEVRDEDFADLSHRLLEKFSEIANSNIVGLPLLMRMTAEIFEDPTKENLTHKVNSLSITSVFQKFVAKYLLGWTNNENEIARNETVEFQLSGGVLEIHHKIAINHKFDEAFMTFDIVESDAEKISRVGLIRFDKSEKTFQFIHETFAEYFVADFICFHLIKKNQDPSHDCSNAVQILIEVLFERYGFRVIRTFLDQSLEAMKFIPSETFCKSMAKCLSEISNSRNSFAFLRNSLIGSRGNLTSLLLLPVKFVEKDLLLKIIQSNFPNDDNALLIAARFGNNAIVSTLCNIITTCTDNPKDFYQANGIFGNVFLSAARVNENAGVLTTLCANLSDVITKDEIKLMLGRENRNDQNIIAIAAEYQIEVFPELLSLLPNYFSHGEIKNLLLAVDNRKRNFFQLAVIRDTNESLKLKFDVVKSYFGVEEQKTFFFCQPATAPNIFHCAAKNRNGKIFETLIEFTRGVLSDDEIKSMLMQKDSDGFHVIHIIAEHGNEVVLNELNLLLRERLSDDEIRSLLLEVNVKGQNCFRLAANNAKLNLQIFCETIGNLISVEDQTRLLQQSSGDIDIISLACGRNTMEIVPVETIKDMLTKKDDDGRNAFQKIAEDGDIDTWCKLISFTKARFSADEIKSFLFSCDRNGMNCLHLAVSENTNRNVIETICKTIESVGLSIEDQKKFVRQKDSRNENVFHLAATSFETFKCFSLYDCLSSIISKHEIKEMLKEKKSGRRNILLCVNRKYSRYHGVSTNFMQFLQEVFTNDEIKTLFFDVDAQGGNFFHCAVQFSSKSEIESLSKAIKKILSKNDQKKFFGSKSRNVFHLATRNLNSGILTTLHECLQDVLTENEIKSLIQEKNSKNKNILHSICHHNEWHSSYDIEKWLRDFFKVVKDILDAVEFKNLLTSIDSSHGSNCVLLAAQFQGQHFVKTLFRFIQKELSISDQRDLFQKYDTAKKNIFKCASLNEDPEMFSFVEHFSSEILSESQIEKMKT